ncbi:uncharacterized protein VTP21DRAFT_11401 [Calcarisporiella thermophila]|uniref:uncharacterized protein n=1 Tax=Calcarisporiella thermophila TaxID=911321 RepID=UPI0037430CB3
MQISLIFALFLSFLALSHTAPLASLRALDARGTDARVRRGLLDGLINVPSKNEGGGDGLLDNLIPPNQERNNGDRDNLVDSLTGVLNGNKEESTNGDRNKQGNSAPLDVDESSVEAPSPTPDIGLVPGSESSTENTTKKQQNQPSAQQDSRNEPNVGSKAPIPLVDELVAKATSVIDDTVGKIPLVSKLLPKQATSSLPFPSVPVKLASSVPASQVAGPLTSGKSLALSTDRAGQRSLLLTATPSVPTLRASKSSASSSVIFSSLPASSSKKPSFPLSESTRFPTSFNGKTSRPLPTQSGILSKEVPSQATSIARLPAVSVSSNVLPQSSPLPDPENSNGTENRNSGEAQQPPINNQLPNLTSATRSIVVKTVTSPIIPSPSPIDQQQTIPPVEVVPDEVVVVTLTATPFPSKPTNAQPPFQLMNQFSSASARIGTDKLTIPFGLGLALLFSFWF